MNQHLHFIHSPAPTFALRLPLVAYTLYQDFGEHGIGGCADFDNINAVADAAADKAKFRVIRTDFCPETNLPEHVSDVTEEVAAIHASNRKANGLEADQ